MAFTSASELAELIRAKKLSPVELVEHLLERISRLDPKLNAYLTVAEAEAREAARAAEAMVMQGATLPPLHGLPVAIKDTEATKGIRTTGGSLVYEDFVPDEDSVIAERLRRAGAILLAKTNTPEFALLPETSNRLGGDCRNPWDLERTCGGSSGGSAAAVAAGLVPLATGSDGGGSIRAPSSLCGVFGLKPTFGRVPVYGSLACTSSLISLGPITRTVGDAALLLQVLAGRDRRDPTSLREEPPDFLSAVEGEIRGLRIAWSPDLGHARVREEVESTAGSSARVFESLGCVVEEATPAVDDTSPTWGPIWVGDVYAWGEPLLEERVEALTAYGRWFLEQGRKITVSRYCQSLRGAERLRMQMADFFEKYDLLLTPTLIVPAWRVGRMPELHEPLGIDSPEAAPIFAASTAILTQLFNVTGQPAATVPCGFSPKGMPIGLQIIGRWGDEVTVLRAAAAFERARPWADKTPPLA